HLSTIEKWVVCPVADASSSATDGSADEAAETEHGSPGSAPKSGMRVPSSAICVARDARYASDSRQCVGTGTTPGSPVQRSRSANASRIDSSWECIALNEPHWKVADGFACCTFW